MIAHYHESIARSMLNKYIDSLLAAVTIDPARFSRMVGGLGQPLCTEQNFISHAKRNAEFLGDDSALAWLEAWPNVYTKIDFNESRQ